MAVADEEGIGPLLAPGFGLGGEFVVPAELRVKHLGDVVHVERRVVVVPAEDAEFGEVVAGILDEVGEGDGAVGVFAVGGDEEEVVSSPSLTLGLPRRCALFQDERAEDEPHDDDGEALLLEVHPEDAPRLVAIERAELFDFLDAHGGFRGDAEFGAGVIEADVLDVVGLDGPVEFVTEVGDEGREGLDAAEAVEVGVRHWKAYRGFPGRYGGDSSRTTEEDAGRMSRARSRRASSIRSFSATGREARRCR